MKVVFIILLICFFGLVDSFGQVSEYIYTQFTVREGLPSNECYDVVEDFDGYIWISTDNGIARFDGTEFRHYGVAHGLLDQVIFRLEIDEVGRLWAGGLKGEFYIYNELNDRFELWKNNEVLAQFNSKEDNFIRDFEIMNGSLSLMKTHYGVVTIEDNGGFSIDSIGQLEAYQIVVKDKKAYLDFYFLNDDINPIANFKFQDTTYLVEIPVPESEVASLVRTIYFNQQCIISIYGLTTGVKNGKVKWTRKENNINKFKVCRDGSLIACFGNGGGVRKYINEAENYYETIIDDISASNFYEDKKGGYWITSTDKGLVYIKNVKIKYLSTNHTSKYYTDVISDKKGQIYTATFGGELGVYNLTNGYFDLVYNTFGSEFISCNYNEYDDKVYFSFKASLFKIDENRNVIDLTKKLSINDQNTIRTIKDAFFESSKMHLIAIGRSYCTLNIEDGEYFLTESFHNEFDNIYRGNKIVKSKSNNIYVGDANGLQVRALCDDKDFVPDSLFIGLRIEDIIEDKSERLILGTKGRGLAVYNPRNSRVVYIDKSHGLISNNLEDIEHQEDDIYWVASLKGISRVDFSDLNNPIIDNYTMSHGLPVPDVYDLAWSDGILYAATGEGVIRIIDEMLDYPSPMPIIKSVKVNNEEKVLEEEYNLEYNENSVVIDYKTINHAHASAQKYRYKINEEEWIITNQTKLILSNLSSGDYDINIKSENENGIWSPSTFLKIRLNKPWWNTWWFYLIVFFSIIGGIIYYYKQREKRIANKNAFEKELRSLEKAALQSQMNPHFIFNCLNSIQNFIMSNDKLAAMDYLSQFAKLIRLTLNASSEEVISLYEEVQMLNHYLSLEKLRFKSKFDFILDVDMDLHMHDTQIPPMLIQPLVENAIKHGMKDRSEGGKIEVMFARKDNKVVVTVRDNGVGFSEDGSNSLHKSMGMDITKKRLGSEDGVAVRRVGNWTEVEVVV